MYRILNKKILPSNSYSNFLKVSIDIGYYHLVIPFRIKKNGEGSWVLHLNKIQQVLCGISHVLLLYQYFSEIRSFPYEKLDNHPTEYFKCFQRIWGFFYHVLLSVVLWKDKEKFHAILKYLNQTPHLPINSTKIQSKFYVALICIFYVLVSTTCQVFGYGVVANPSDWKSPTWFYRRYVQTARYNFFITSHNNYTIAPDPQDISTADSTLALVTFVGSYFRNIFACYSDVLVLMSCLTLWVPARGLASLVRFEISKISQPHQIFYKSSTAISKIADSYFALRELSLIINDAMGFVMLAFLVDDIIYFSTHLNAVFIATDWLRRARAGTLFAIGISVLFISGDICKQVEEMHEWLSLKEVSDTMSPNNLALLLNEVKHHYIGISGNIFIIDYPAIFNIISTLITYFIICAQGDKA